MVEITIEQFESYERIRINPDLSSILPEEVIVEIKKHYDFWKNYYGEK